MKVWGGCLIFHEPLWPGGICRLLRHIIAVEPLDFRRNLAATGAFGATMAVKPSEAMEAVKSVAPKGADVVLEMVGHNQETWMSPGMMVMDV